MNFSHKGTVAAALLCLAVLLYFRSGSTPLEEDAASSPLISTLSGKSAPFSPEVPGPEWFPLDKAESSHPVESAVARGRVLDSRVEPGIQPGHWWRVRLVETDVQARPVRIVEEWTKAPGTLTAQCLRRDMYLADQIIVKTTRSTKREQLDELLRASGLRVEAKIAEEIYSLRLPEAKLDSTDKATEVLRTHPGIIESAEADGIGFGGNTASDPRFFDQWGLYHTGAGVADTDVDASEFWDVFQSATGIVIAVLDSGMNYSHPDLQGISWTNPGEIPGDNIDNDGSGKIDDTRGWDFVNNDNFPNDDQGHGSHVTGIIAARRNNGVGVAGLLDGVSILSCKILNSSNSGTTSNLIAATAYARQRGATIFNLSLQSYPYSSLLDAEFSTCASAGILLSICAGNQGSNNDFTPNYPSSYTYANIIAVANHSRFNVRWNGTSSPSNYGAQSVDIFAPGTDILSTVLGSNSSAYDYYTGTSMSAPFVTAVCAALKSANPSWTATEIKSAVLQSARPFPAYAGLCTSGGRLNTIAALGSAATQLPRNDTDQDGYSNLVEYLAGTRIDWEASRPVISSELENNTLSIMIPHTFRPDAHFRIEKSTDLVDWTTSGVVESPGSFSFSGSCSTTGQTRAFLRVVAVPQP